MRDRRRGFAHHDRAGAKTLDDEAEASQLLRMRVDQRRRLGIEIDDERREQHLPLDPALIAFALEPLIDDAFMRRVLVDDDDPVACLSDDVILVHLRSRRAERGGEVVLAGDSRRRRR